MSTYLYGISLEQGKGKDRDFKHIHVLAPTIEKAFAAALAKYAGWRITNVSCDDDDEVIFAE